MKRILILTLAVIFCFMLVSCSESDAKKEESILKEEDIIGIWRCELYGSDLTIEFTPDGKFISHTDGIENRFIIEDGCIVTYVEGDVESGVPVEAKVASGKLIYGGVEYERVNDLR